MKDYGGNKKLNIWFDISHVAQYNFYKNFIIRLSEEGHMIYVTVLNRGKMPKIIETELRAYSNNVQIDKIGRHRLSKVSAVVDANLIRLIKLVAWASKKHIDLAFSNGYQNGIIGKMKNFSTYTFDDDPQTWDYKPKIWFSKQSHYCLYEPPKNYNLSTKVKVLRVLKEWAYLAPDVFTPNPSVLKRYNLNPREYFFIREVSVGTVNYSNQEKDSIKDVKLLIPKNKKVLFSIEDKTKRGLYPKDWILLKEPVDDVHSLVYYSCGLISSGDSFAREAALLGIQAYYLGIRKSMPANLVVARLSMLYNSSNVSFNKWISQFNDDEKKDYNGDQKKIRDTLSELFIDINEYLYSLIPGNVPLP